MKTYLQRLLPRFRSEASRLPISAGRNPKLAHFTRIGSLAAASSSSSASAESSPCGSVEGRSGRSPEFKAAAMMLAQGQFFECMVRVMIGANLSFWCAWLAYQGSWASIMAAAPASWVWYSAWVHARRSGRLYALSE